ncbi:unnamed protein product [Allacma fusca]|uniref:Uncharacterized protein n=1 Tax=Allacma fusca TaxID=39272 RepID=A0A8J2JYH2_9HEXA|nr:unnamed protein product [Allacma fusca]
MQSKHQESWQKLRLISPVTKSCCRMVEKVDSSGDIIISTVTTIITITIVSAGGNFAIRLTNLKASTG